MNKHIIPILVVLLLLSSGFVGVSNNIEEKEQDMMNEDYAFYRYNEHDYPEGYLSNKRTFVEHAYDVKLDVLSEPEATPVTPLVEKKNYEPPQIITSGGPMDSPWPMHGHDAYHTGRSPYSTSDNTGFEKWRFSTEWDVEGGAVNDANGSIYFGTLNGYFYALYPNGTQKWKTKIAWFICGFGASPAIDENGVIYVPTKDGLYALNPNGTIKWKHSGYIESSPVIGDDGTIYFCVETSGYVKAIYPNGTLKWGYKTDHHIQSSPAIGLDGTVYCGSHDNYVYALYPSNGALRWKFKTGGWVHGSPSIGPDGTVYIGSDDHYLYALYPNNGTMKWKLHVGDMRCSPSIDKNGVLYFGVWQENFFAVYPNGTIKWSFDLGEDNGMWGSTAAISDDGTIYFGTCIDIGYLGGGDIIALNSDGIEKWRLRIATDYVTSSPCIGEDGTIYVGSSNDLYHPGAEGYLHALDKMDTNAPSAPVIDGPSKVIEIFDYEYNFTATSPIGNNIYYWIEWGDNMGTGWLGPYPSGQKITVSHGFLGEGTKIIKARAKDTDNLWGPWGEFEIEVTNIRPTAPEIDGPKIGKAGVVYNYTFKSIDPDGHDLRYYLNWGDGNTELTDFYSSGEEVIKSHSWTSSGIFTISAMAKDRGNAESDWATLKVIMPMNLQAHNSWFLQFLQNHPRMFPILRLLLGFD